MTLEQCAALDAQDALGHKRDAFYLPSGAIYLDGNSLGVLPQAAKARALEVIQQQWGEDLITSWNKHEWITLPQRCGEKIATLIGAAPGQVVACDSTSINLFKVLAAALSLNAGRSLILSQSENFPTDLYMGQGLQGLLGNARCQLRHVAADALYDSLDDSVAVLMLTHVDFRSGKMHDMHALTQRAHEVGALVVWDLAHSAGAVPLALDECAVDFAVGCGYKYLNGGPGAPAFVYVAKRHHQRLEQPLSGWMGHASPFAFSPNYAPAEGIQRMLCGTPSVIAMAILDEALNVFADISMQHIRDKSIALSETFLALKSQHPVLETLQLVSPTDPHQRGSQLAFAHPDSYGICQALIARGVTPDFRAPDILRLGFCPLYNSFSDMFAAVQLLAEVVASGSYLDSRFQTRQKVT